MICAYCGDDHSWFYCRKKPEGWKPPKNSQAKASTGNGRSNAPLDSAPASGEASRLSGGSGTATSIPKRRGRPPTGFDKAEYNRDYMRKRRAKLKANLH